MLGLRDHVTVFHITAGDINYPDSLASLQRQDCQFRLETIRGVAPLHKAFQRMLDDCETDYLIEVDEDMILYPHAIRRMYEGVLKTPPQVAFLSYWLYDPHLERNVMGVKIYKHDIVRRYPYRDSYSCEVDQFKRLERDGYCWEARSEVLGEHSPKWTPYSIFCRWKSLIEKHRHSGGLGWVREYLPIFKQRLETNPTEEDWWALLGAIAGALSSSPLNQERDYHTYGKEEFRGLQELFNV